MADSPLNPRRAAGRSPFDVIRKTDTDPEKGEFEYWSAREAMSHLGYAKWENMANVIRKAKSACRNSGHSVAENFRDVRKVSGQRGPGQEDTQLSRLGMYLVAMNGDPDKFEIAAAQRYFVIQTRRAEVELPPTPLSHPAAPPPSIEPWAVRFSRTFSPHVRDLYQRHPGCFTVVSAVVSEILSIEDQIVRHQMTTRAFDRPDISVGRTYSEERKRRNMQEATKTASLFLPDQGFPVEVRVYEGVEWPIFSMWFRGSYLSEKLPAYLHRKPELSGYPALSRASAADNACRDMSGRPAVLSPDLRAQLNAAGGFAPARPLPPGPNRPRITG